MNVASLMNDPPGRKGPPPRARRLEVLRVQVNVLVQGAAAALDQAGRKVLRGNTLRVGGRRRPH